MPETFGDINSPYSIGGDIRDINKPYLDLEEDRFQYPSIPLEPDLEDAMDEDYQGGGGSGGGLFGDILGPGANVYDSQSIADALMEQYGMEGLTAGMFPALSEELVAASQAETYDAYKQMLGNPLRKDYRQEVSQTAGMLNPNKKRKRALTMYRAGMSDINRNIFSKTSAARGEMKNWLSNALKKVKRMQY